MANEIYAVAKTAPAPCPACVHNCECVAHEFTEDVFEAGTLVPNVKGCWNCGKLSPPTDQD